MHRLKGVVLPTLLLLLIGACQTVLAESISGDPAELSVENVPDEGQEFRVRIADPFIELHTGPGAGYPIFHVIDRGEEVRILRRKTSWFRIETDSGLSGWASREQMRLTLTPSGEQLEMVELDTGDFARRKWAIGMTGGQFEDTPVFTFFTAYSFSEGLAGEVHLGQSIGSRSSSTFLKGNLVMQPLPDLRFSPYLTLGIGRIEVSPSSTLITVDDEVSTMAQFGLGLQTYLSRSFLFRIEANEYVIFSSSSSSPENEEIEEWKLGFAVFF